MTLVRDLGPTLTMMAVVLAWLVSRLGGLPYTALVLGFMPGGLAK